MVLRNLAGFSIRFLVLLAIEYMLPPQYKTFPWIFAFGWYHSAYCSAVNDANTRGDNAY